MYDFILVVFVDTAEMCFGSFSFVGGDCGDGLSFVDGGAESE